MGKDARRANRRLRLHLLPLEPRLLLSGFTYHVDDDAPSDPAPGDMATSDPLEDGSVAHPFDSIQEALDAAASGDSVVLEQGTYYESSISYGGKAITLTGTDPSDPDVVAATVVDGGAQASVFVFNGEAADSVLTGLTVTNGRARFGGGIYVLDASPTISHSRIVGNVATYPSADADGGGIYFVLSESTVTDTVITGNAAGGMGAGVYAWRSPITVSNTIVSGNVASWGGGGFSFLESTSVSLANCTVVGNFATYGGGVWLYNGSEVALENSIVWNNSAFDGPQLALNSPNVAETSSPSILTVTYSDVMAGPAYVYVEPGSTLTWGTGAMAVTPQFADAGSWGVNSWREGDYHLKSTGGRWDPGLGDWALDDVASPLVDAGHPSFDHSGEPEPNGDRINMGAYGGTVQASKMAGAAEINGTIWRDMNGDGVRDPGDNSLPRWTVFLDMNVNGVLDDGERSTESNRSGDYSFTGMIDGTYTVAASLAGGWTQTDPAGLVEVELDWAEVATDVDIGIHNPALGIWRLGGVQVSAYDMAGPVDVDVDDIRVAISLTGSVSITISGSQAMGGLGITIWGATSVTSIKDARKGGGVGEIAFIASNAPIKSLQTNAVMAGYDLNGQSIGGFEFAVDIDGDGETDDAMALYCDGAVQTFKLTADVTGDFWIGGTEKMCRYVESKVGA